MHATLYTQLCTENYWSQTSSHRSQWFYTQSTQSGYTPLITQYWSGPATIMRHFRLEYHGT